MSKNLKSKLIKNVIEEFAISHAFDFSSNFKHTNNLQKLLDDNLKFKTTVSRVISENGFFGKIIVGENEEVEFSILPSIKTSNN